MLGGCKNIHGLSNSETAHVIFQNSIIIVKRVNFRLNSIPAATKFDAPGLNFKAKLIGIEDVADPRGDKMCQVAMAKSKAAVLAMGDHKQRITVNISLDGIKLLDEKTEVSIESSTLP